jgi:hypothetical protein
MSFDQLFESFTELPCHVNTAAQDITRLVYGPTDRRHRHNATACFRPRRMPHIEMLCLVWSKPQGVQQYRLQQEKQSHKAVQSQLTVIQIRVAV